jgi:hypothetical protein
MEREYTQCSNQCPDMRHISRFEEDSPARTTCVPLLICVGYRTDVIPHRREYLPQGSKSIHPVDSFRPGHSRGAILKPSLKRCFLVIALAGACGPAGATPLVFNTPTSGVDATLGFFGGALLASEITSIGNLSYSGLARAAVYDTGAGLDFYYQFSSFATSKNGVERFSAYDFSSLGGALVNVYQTSAAFGIFTAGTEQSDYADRTSFGVIGFNFVPNGASKIDPGFTSYTQIIRTSARTYVAGNFGLLDGIGDNARAFAPASPVPEPETSTLVLAGLGLLGAIARRRLRI